MRIRDAVAGAPRQRGLSLIELLVAMVIGLVLMLAVTSIAMDSSRVQNELSKTSRQAENGRYAMQMLTREIQLAGFYGELADLPDPPGALPDPCDTAIAALETAIILPIQGYDGGTSAIPACVQAAGHVAGTDVLVLRRTSTIAETGGLDAAQIYLQSRSTWPPRLQNPPFAASPDWDAFPIRRLRTDIYFIGDDGTGPALSRLELNAGAIQSTAVFRLVDDIENLQLDYGIDRSGDGAPSAFDLLPAYRAAPALDEWPDVVAVRVHLLARNPEPTLGYADEKSYRLGIDANGAPNVIAADGAAFKRKLYTSTVRAVNRSIRRE
jgi:type IV pilus assembly protein PilW